MKILIAILLAFCLGMGSVAADELWVKNEGGLEITIWSDSEWQDVTATGGDLLAIGPCDPSEEPEPGKAKIANVTLSGDWVVIHADNITDYRVDVACNQSFESIEPEIRLVTDEQPAKPEPKTVTYKNQDSGPSIVEAVEYDWTGQEVWLWT